MPRTRLACGRRRCPARGRRRLAPALAGVGTLAALLGLAGAAGLQGPALGGPAVDAPGLAAPSCVSVAVPPPPPPGEIEVFPPDAGPRGLVAEPASARRDVGHAVRGRFQPTVRAPALARWTLAHSTSTSFS